MGSLLIVPPPQFSIATDAQGIVLLPPGQPPVRFRTEPRVFMPGTAVEVKRPRRKPPPVPPVIFTASQYNPPPTPGDGEFVSGIEDIISRREELLASGGVVLVQNEGRLETAQLTELLDAMQADARDLMIYLSPSQLFRAR